MTTRWRVDCWRCDEGYLEGEGCTCGEDACCCLEPDPPMCDICKGSGWFEVTKLTDDNCAIAYPVD